MLGEFRKSQNWIGPSGSTLKTASFIPTASGEMDICLNDLEKYIREGDKVDDLIKLRRCIINLKQFTHLLMEMEEREGC